MGVICFACIIIIKKLLAVSKDRYRNNWHSFFLHTTCVKHISSHNWGSAKKVEFLWNWSLSRLMYAISYWPCLKWNTSGNAVLLAEGTQRFAKLAIPRTHSILNDFDLGNQAFKMMWDGGWKMLDKETPIFQILDKLLHSQTRLQ